MKANEKLRAFRAKSETELKAEKIDLLKAQFNLRMQKGTKQLKQNHNFKNVRRDIARICTVLSEKHTTGS